MIDPSNIKLTITFNDPRLESEELEAEVQNLLFQMRDLDEVENLVRVLDPNPPQGHKAVGAILAGMLMAEVSPANIKKLMGFLGDRLGNKPIELEVEDNGRKLKVKASSKEELTAAIEAAQKFLAK